MGHFHLSVIQDGHLADLLAYIYIINMRIFLFDLLYKSAVDLLHDLVNPGKQPGEQVDGPFLQCFCHDGMVGVGAGSGGNVPCLVPAQIIIIQKDAHQLGDGHRGMGIVELESYLLRETVNIVMFSHIFLHCLLYGCGDEEILLFQTQLLACVVVVVGIEHVHQVPGQILLLNRLAVVTLVKSVQTEACHGLRIPDTQGIHNAVAVSHDGKIVGNGSHCLITLLHEMISAVLVAVYGHVAAEFHHLGILGPAQFKRIAVRQPVVRHLDLETVLNLLFEHTVTVADGRSRKQDTPMLPGNPGNRLPDVPGRRCPERHPAPDPQAR